MRGAIPPLLHVFFAWNLVQHGANFTFILPLTQQYMLSIVQGL